jgi:DegV family protein with EDD domain
VAVRLVTDSTCDIPPDLCGRYGVTVVPLTVHFGDESFRDRIDLDSETFFARLAKDPQLPHTAQPSPAAFGQVYEELLGQGHEVLSVHVSARLSGAYNSAVLARAGCSAPDSVTVIDSGWTSMCLGMAVLAGARAAQQGEGPAAVQATVEGVLARTDLLLFLDTLEYLHRGGRIGAARSLVGTLLSIKPLITIKRGEVHPAGQVRTRARAIERLRQWVTEHPQVAAFTVLHTVCPEDAHALFDDLRRSYPDAEAYLTEVGAVVATHVGPNAIGVALHG